MPPKQKPLELLTFPNAGKFESWLSRHVDTAPTVGLLISKKGAAAQTVSYAEALEIALCYGWIDGKKMKHDEFHWVQTFSKRKPKSIWSQINRDKALALIAEGKMKPSGASAIEAAKTNGLWENAYQPIRSREVPPELAQALAAHPKAKKFFDALSSKDRFAFVFRSTNAKRAETKKARIEKFIKMLEKGEVLD